MYVNNIDNRSHIFCSHNLCLHCSYLVSDGRHRVSGAVTFSASARPFVRLATPTTVRLGPFSRSPADSAARGFVLLSTGQLLAETNVDVDPDELVFSTLPAANQLELDTERRGEASPFWLLDSKNGSLLETRRFRQKVLVGWNLFFCLDLYLFIPIVIRAKADRKQQAPILTTDQNSKK